VAWQATQLREEFADGPEPEQTARRAAALLDVAGSLDSERLERIQRERSQTLGRVLRAVCGVAPFLSRFLTRHPAWLLQLAEDELWVGRSLAEYQALLARALEDALPEEVGARLRRFKYAELARITVRDCCDEWVPLERVDETLAELSHLAESILSAALDHSLRELCGKPGPATWRNAAGDLVPLRFVVLGLGKLGGEQLNYSSDVDLIYVYENPPDVLEPLGHSPRDISAQELFTRLAKRFGTLVEETTEEGFLYRVDLDLRPEGAQGALVISANALLDYYDGWAASWEKAAFMKARPVAGDLAFGWQIARAIDPMIYQSSVDFAALDSIREMKSKIERAHRDADSDVKLGAGGIRDLEFVAQAHQLLHGGKIPQVRGRSAPGALQALMEVGVLCQEDATDLGAAYRFLRRVENRLQMEAERQTHRLPPPGPARERLARSIGFSGADAEERFAADLQAHRDGVRARFDALFDLEGGGRVLELFERSAPDLARRPETRAMVENLAEQFSRALERSANPELAMNNLDRFIQGVGSRSFYYGLLLDRPELVPRLASLFGASRYLSAIFATHPELIQPVFSDPERLLTPRSELGASFSTILQELRSTGHHDEEALGLSALRLFQHRELVNVGLLDLSGKLDLVQVESALTDVAEECLEQALVVARQQVARQRPDDAALIEAGDFLVVGMGKLGSRELTYGSDLDVIFLYDMEGDEMRRAQAQQPFVRLAQKIGWALQTRTAEGVCYEVDARLRPSGNQGMLVTSLPAFRRYHQGSAQAWERQSLLRARPVTGSVALGRSFGSLRSEILGGPLPPDLATEIHRIRRRMESELAQESADRRDLKTGRGGLLDVEMVVQLLQLRFGRERPELLEARRIDALLSDIESAGLLPAEQVGVLREGWGFLQRLSSRLRVVENRSISDLSGDRSDLDPVARALGYPSSSLTGTARVPLLDDYRRHTEAIRRVYEAVFAASGGEA